MPPRPDLAVLLPPRPLGGHEKALLHWLRDAVHRHGLQPALLGVDDTLAAACARAGLDRHLLPRSGLAQAPLGRPLLLAPGVLHARAALLAAALARRHAVWVYVPMAYRASTMGYRGGALRDALLAPWLRRVSGWITIDERQQALLRDAWGIRAPIHVLPNQVALQAPALPPPVPAATLRVACVGRFDAWQKGLDWLAGRLAAGAPWTRSCRWLFQGAGPAEPMLLQLASTLGPHRVQVRSFAPLEQALADADVLLLPSRYEGVPLVALEATVLGRPVVASHDAGLAALLPGSSQFAFGDAAGLAQALASLATPAAREAALAHARARLPQLTQPRRYRATLQSLVQGWRSEAAR